MNTSLSAGVNPTNLMQQSGQSQGELRITKGSGCLGGFRGSGFVQGSFACWWAHFRSRLTELKSSFSSSTASLHLLLTIRPMMLLTMTDYSPYVTAFECCFQGSTECEDVQSSTRRLLRRDGIETQTGLCENISICSTGVRPIPVGLAFARRACVHDSIAGAFSS